MTTSAVNARSAAQAVRQLAHSTAGDAGYPAPADLYDVLGELAALAHDLSPVLAQAGRWLDQTHTRGLVGHDTRPDATETVYDVIGDLERSSREARSLAYTLDSAHEGASHLTAHDHGGRCGR
jgi:hypothetical protein